MTTPVTYSQSTSYFSGYNYDTYRVIETYPHTSDFVYDQSICDEFSLELIPVHCDKWGNKRNHIAEYTRNSDSLNQGNEILSFLDRKSVQTGEPCVQQQTITNLTEHLLQGGEEWYPSEVPGITDDHFPITGEQFGIFPDKYDPLPSISCHLMNEIGYGSQAKVPTNTALSETTVVASTRRSMAEIHELHPFH